MGAVVIPYYKTERGSLYYGDCAEIMPRLENNVDMVITSPPYDNLRNYKGYVFHFEDIAQELYRIVKPGGVVVWVVGDATVDGSETGTSFKQALYFKEIGFRLHDTMIYEKSGSPHPAGCRSNRYSQIFEYMFILSKGAPATANLIKDKKNQCFGIKRCKNRTERQKNGNLKKCKIPVVEDYGYRNNIWHIMSTGSANFKQNNLEHKHPAIFPDSLARDHILSWSNKDDIILDPMAGSGTVARMCERLGRRWIGIEISKEYCGIAKQRIENEIIQYKLPGF